MTEDTLEDYFESIVIYLKTKDKIIQEAAFSAWILFIQNIKVNLNR